MKEFTYTITNELGLHARPAGMLVRKAGEFKSRITLECGGKSVDASKLIAVMGMGVKLGDTVRFAIEGEDEDKAAARLEIFARDNL